MEAEEQQKDSICSRQLC